MADQLTEAQGPTWFLGGRRRVFRAGSFERSRGILDREHTENTCEGYPGWPSEHGFTPCRSHRLLWLSPCELTSKLLESAFTTRIVLFCKSPIPSPLRSLGPKPFTLNPRPLRLSCKLFRKELKPIESSYNLYIIYSPLILPYITPR